ncbi:MAG: LPS-assembly protein LptD [Deltaproteobacteria bacterium]|nr:LPS-assembly protein LptD [Deltaproteobacteria bacterium]
MPKRLSTLLILIFSMILWGLPFSSQGQENIFSLGSETTKEPWEIEARELSYDKDTDVYTAVGEVVIKKDQRVLTCDYAQVDQKTMIALARGNVVFKAAGDELAGDELTFDLNKQTGEVKQGRLFLKANNFHVTGDQILKTGESSYRIQNGTVTSCDGEDVPWKIKVRELSVTLEGYGQAWHPSFQVKNVPVFYFPYLIFPAKTKRQSGLLMPEPGYSVRDGLTFDLPFFWAISDNTDATFHEYFMSRRGLMQGLEFRYALSPYSKGTLILDYLFKDQAGEEEFRKNNIQEPYSELYWFRSKINQRLPRNMDLKIDLDWASDQDYLREFHGAPNGLNQNRRAFLQEFYRDLDDELQLIRRNTAAFTKSFGTYQFTGGFNYFQELGQTLNTFNQLPYARFDGIKQVLWKKVYYQWGSSYNYYWRENLDRGQVIDLTPTLYYPFKLKNYLNLETSTGLTGTLFQVDNKQSESVDSLGTRAVPNLRLDFSTDIQRIFNFSGKEIQKIKHNIRPQIVYNYVPEVKQDLPSFVSPLSKLNTVTYYLLNTFTAKSLLGKGRQGEDLFGYRDFVWFKLFQTYDFNAAGGTSTTTSLNPDGTTSTTTITDQPFSNVFGELELSPSPNLTLRSTLGWSPHTGKLDSQNYNLTLMDKKGNRAYLEYWATSGDQFRQINGNLFWQINPIWSVNFLTRYSLDQNKNFETTFSAAYTKQCWGVKIHYSNTLDDQKIVLSVTLKGLGEF